MKRVNLILLMLLSLQFLAEGQTISEECGYIVTEESLQYDRLLTDILKNNSRRSFDSNEDVPLANIPVQFHIVRRSDGTGSLAESDIPRLLQQLNDAFEPASMQFFENSSVRIINNDEFYDFDSAEEGALTASTQVNNVINIYFPGGRLTSGNSNLCGYAYFPPSLDAVFIAADCAGPTNSTLVHEVGHYFSLFHTHGKTNTGTTDELVNGSNCQSAGDNVCDTPADPNLTGFVNNCVYGGGLRDANNDLYFPMVNNYMSYAPGACRDAYTNGQYERIRGSFDNFRTNLAWTSTEFLARISADIVEGCAPLTVKFKDITIAGVSREWTFTGGDISRSAGTTPVVTYNTPGTYNVKLLARNSNGTTNEVLREGFIVVNDVFENVGEKYTESFAGLELPEKWNINNPDFSLTFESNSTSATDDGTGSLYLNNFNYDVEVRPTYDELKHPSIDINEMSSLIFQFDYAYTYKPGIIDLTDSLIVGYRLDCSADFVELFKKGGDDLKTAAPLETEFVPNNSDWSKISLNVDVSAIAGINQLDVMTFALQAISDNGNNLYLDNFEVIPDYSIVTPNFFRLKETTATSIQINWNDPAHNETGFIVERSTDGLVFEEIERLPMNSLTYIDTDVDPEVGVYFYRVASFNSNTQSEYSPILEIPFSVTAIVDTPDLKEEITLFPNPTANTVNISVRNEFLWRASVVSLLSSDGSLISEKEIVFSNEVWPISVKDLPMGIYFVRLDFSDISIIKKVIVIK